MNTDTTADSTDQAAPPAPAGEVEDDGRIITEWFPKRPGTSYVSAVVLFFLAGVIFQDYFLNPAVKGTELTGAIAILVIFVVIFRLLAGATSYRKTILDLDNATLTVLRKRLGMRSKNVYKAKTFSEVKLRQRQPMDKEDQRLVLTDPLTLSLYSYDLDTEIKCGQGMSPGEMRELAQIVADVFDVKFDNEIHHPKAINPFWPE